MDNNEKLYADIINLPHHVSKKRPQMSRINRAAQFAPFAALTGHDEAIRETARLTDRKIEIDEGTKAIINEKLQIAVEFFSDLPEVTVTYFVSDGRKSGGAYIDYTGVIKKVDSVERVVVFTDKSTIRIDDIFDVEGEIYKSFE